MKKALSVMLCLVLCLSLSVSAFAASEPVQNTTGGSMLLETEVPTNHKITITYNDGGYVLLGNDWIPSGTQLTVSRFDSFDLNVITRPECHVKKVLVNGEDMTDKMLYGQLTIEKVHTDMEIYFAFENCADVEPPHEDKCTHLSVSGNVYRDDELFKNAQLDFDLGTIQTQADKNGAYRVEDLKDGLHKVVISDENGKVCGEEIFSIAVEKGLAEPKVERLANGTQVVFVPENAKDCRLDFIVHSDGSIEIRPTIEIPGEPTDNGAPHKAPTIAKTGKMLYETPGFFGAIFFVSLSLLLLLVLLPVWSRKKEEEEETAKAVQS